MPTTKPRINLSLSIPTSHTLRALAKRDRLPVATKAARLLELALEIEEDTALEALAADRDATATQFVSHEQAWK